MKSVRFHPSARAELLASARMYRDESPGLGRAFGGEIRRVVSRVLDFPSSGAPDAIRDGVRRVLLDRFPFILIYRATPDEALVLAVMHERRQPNYWRERVE